MGRPAIAEDKKKKALSVTLPQELHELAASTGNSSQFVQASIETCRGLHMLVEDLRAGKIKKAEFIEDMEDLIDVWARQTEEAVSVDAAFPPAKARAKRA